MDKFFGILAVVIALASAFVWGWCVGGRKAAVSKTETTTHDTLWTEIHDTTFVESSVNFLRKDTVRLAVANGYENAISGTYQDRYVHENGKSGTYRDTLILHDSVYVEIPIEQKTFTGDNYRITAHGYGIGLDEVWINRPTIYVTKTSTKTKRWAFNVGAQIGYGYTVHGGSPYIGLGVGFGYTF